MKFYKLTSTNQKSLCKTYADHACLSIFVDLCLELLDSDDTATDRSTTSSNLKSNQMLLHEATYQSAIVLKEIIEKNLDSLPVNVLNFYTYGIIIGSMTLTSLTS